MDVSERDDLLAQIAQLQQEIEDLRQSNQHLEQFAYVASHDLAAPLRTVEGYLTLIHKQIEEHQSEEMALFFTHVFDGLKRMQQLIKDLLEYSRAGRMVERQTIHVKPLLEIVKYNLRQSLQEGDIEIKVGQMPETIQGHRMGVTQLFQNLLSNAIKFCEKDKANTINISCEEDEHSWTFSVRDSGIGIAPEDQGRIFDLFVRLHHREMGDQGTGIGLALCRRIAESHGGKIWLKSEPGKGSTFFVTLKKPTQPS